MDLNLEHCRLSGKICCLILLREGYVYFYFVAGILAYELILERIDEGMGTDLKRMILTLAALKCNAINKSLEVDHCGIAVCNRSVCNGNSSCVVISLFLYCCLYLFVRYGGIDLGYLNTKILAKLYFRSYSNLCCEDERLAGLDLYHVDGRSGYDVNTALLYCCRIVLLDQGVCCVLIEHCLAVHLLDHLSRNFTFTETRHADLAFFFQVSSLDCFLYFFGSHFNGKLCHILF